MDALPPSGRAQRLVSLDALRAMLGCETGVSDWIEISQGRIDAFAALSGDHQFIHTDPAKAAQTPMGGTIAHGFHILSLLTYLATGARPRLEGVVHSLNYGIDRLRFVTPVPAGARVRARFALAGLTERKRGEILQEWEVTVEIEGQDVAEGGRPALVCRWLSLSVLGGA